MLAGGLVAVVAGEVAKYADGHVPRKPQAHDGAAVGVIARVVEAKPQGVVTAPSARIALEDRFCPLPSLKLILSPIETPVVSAKITGQANAEPVTAASAGPESG